MGVEFAEAAGKHGVAPEDAVYAMVNALYVEPEFDDARVPGRSKPTLYIGPPRQLGGPLLEVMVETIPPRTIWVFHVMEARQKHLDRMGGHT